MWAFSGSTFGIRLSQQSHAKRSDVTRGWLDGLSFDYYGAPKHYITPRGSYSERPSGPLSTQKRIRSIIGHEI